MEYYFSDLNLPRDRFLQEKLSASRDGWLELSIIAAFPRMLALIASSDSTASAPRSETEAARKERAVDEIAKVLMASKSIEVAKAAPLASADGEGAEHVWHVRRKPAPAAEPHMAAQDAKGAKEAKEEAAAGTVSAADAMEAAASKAVVVGEATCGVMLDVGEGALAAIRRRFGEATDEMLLGLEMVWISHMHADHHLGLVAILEEQPVCYGRPRGGSTRAAELASPPPHCTPPSTSASCTARVRTTTRRGAHLRRCGLSSACGARATALMRGPSACSIRTDGA